jgi:L-glutamine-phosphate cytidylyltransferase
MTVAIILAAGLGSRLRPFTNESPKGMVPVNGKPILHYQFEVLKKSGIEKIIVVTGYLSHKVYSLSGDIKKIENQRWKETNMVASLYCAKEWLTDDVIISYSDIIYQQSVLERLLESKGTSVVSADKEFLRYWKLRLDEPLDDVESFSVNEKSCIDNIGQKVESLNGIEAQYIGLMRFRDEGVKSLISILEKLKGTKQFDKMYMTDLLMEMIESGSCLTASFHKNSWLEIDSVDDLRLAERALKQKTPISLIERMGD